VTAGSCDLSCERSASAVAHVAKSRALDDSFRPTYGAEMLKLPTVGKFIGFRPEPGAPNCAAMTS